MGVYLINSYDRVWDFYMFKLILVFWKKINKFVREIIWNWYKGNIYFFLFRVINKNENKFVIEYMNSNSK